MVLDVAIFYWDASMHEDVTHSARARVTMPARVRDVLRRATQDIHDRLHGHMMFRRLFERTITRDEYRVLLARLYGFHWPLETALYKHQDRQPGLEMKQRRRVHLLVADLKALGLSQAVIAGLPLAPPLPGLDNAGRFLGCLYVREGATLGGRVLAGRIDHLLGSAVDGRRFFAGTNRDSELWRGCCAAIESLTDVERLESMTAAAYETFESFESWINGLEMQMRR
jgi:heme oxygenase (biliverdin-IX-beta and delta-forming)